MESIIENNNEIKYDIYKTLYVIKTDDDLYTIYKSFITKDINALIKDIQNGELNDKDNNIIQDIFESIILVEDKYINTYNNITHDFKPVTNNNNNNKVDIIEDVFKLPRRYGKDKIIKDINKENRKATQAEKAMMSLNTIKNLYCVLERKIVNDIFVERNKYSGSKLLEDDEYRDIIALQELMSNKLKKILNKK